MKTEFLRREEPKKEKATGVAFDILVLSLVMAVLVSVIFLVNHKKINEPQNSDAVSVFKETPFYELLGIDELENIDPVSENTLDKEKDEIISEYIKSGGSVDVFGHFFEKSSQE